MMLSLYPDSQTKETTNQSKCIMRLIDKIQQLDRIDKLIRMKATGGPKELARKIGLGESTLYEYLKLMKEMGAPIEFSRTRNSYYYTADTTFHFGFVAKENKHHEIADVNENTIEYF